MPSPPGLGQLTVMSKEDVMYLSWPFFAVGTLVVLAPVIWLGWWLVAGAGEKVSGHKSPPHGR